MNDKRRGPSIIRPLKQFVVIAHEPELYAELVFIIQATDNTMARNAVLRYYREQGWPEPRSITAKVVEDTQENLIYVAKVDTNPRYIEAIGGKA